MESTMPLGNDIRFEFDAVCEKAWQDEKGKMFVRAVASDDKLDLQRDRMGIKALQKMVDAAKAGVPLLETHRSVFEFGKTVGGELKEMEEGGRKFHQFAVELELDGDFPQGRKLFKEIASGTCKKQLSIGGKLNLKNRDAVSVEMTASGLARTINDLELDHIASTRENQAANPRTSFTEAVAKALDDAEALAKGSSAVENVPQMTLSEDLKKGLQVLAEIGSKGIGGMLMKSPETCPATPTETAPASETGTVVPPAAEKAITPRNTETPKTPATQPEQGALKPEAPKFGQAKKSVPTTADLASDIASILSKKNGKPFPGAATPFGSKTPEETSEETPEETPMTEEEKAIYDSLWTLRHVVAKQVSGAALGPQEKTALSAIVATGPFAPRSGAKGIGGGAYIPDKAPKADSTDVGTSGVSDSRRNIQVGGEIKSTAPTAKDAFDLTMRTLKETGQLPQSTDVVSFGKALGEGMAVLESGLVGKFDAAMGSVLEKSTDIAKEMLTAAFEKISEDSGASFADIKKSIDTVGEMVNEENRRMATMEGRLNRIEKAGGVSHSGPSGTSDPTVRPASKMQRGMWGGLFDGASRQALGRYGNKE
jgi:hypothetical protein